jgi:putative ABC transport system permease protein
MTSHASFWEAVKAAFRSLRGSKLRSFLTLLGIILATTTLIAVMSVISGMDVYIAENVSNMGADGYRVQRMVMLGFDPKKYLEMLRRNPVLTREEFEFLRTRVTLTREIGMVTSRGVTVHQGKEVAEGVGLQGASPNVGVITNYEAEDGHFVSEIEKQSPVERGVHRARSERQILFGHAGGGPDHRGGGNSVRGGRRLEGQRLGLRSVAG